MIKGPKSCIHAKFSEVKTTVIINCKGAVMLKLGKIDRDSAFVFKVQHR